MNILIEIKLSFVIKLTFMLASVFDSIEIPIRLKVRLNSHGSQAIAFKDAHGKLS